MIAGTIHRQIQGLISHKVSHVTINKGHNGNLSTIKCELSEKYGALTFLQDDLHELKHIGLLQSNLFSAFIRITPKIHTPNVWAVHKEDIYFVIILTSSTGVVAWPLHQMSNPILKYLKILYSFAEPTKIEDRHKIYNFLFYVAPNGYSPDDVGFGLETFSQFNGLFSIWPLNPLVIDNFSCNYQKKQLLDNFRIMLKKKPQYHTVPNILIIGTVNY